MVFVPYLQRFRVRVQGSEAQSGFKPEPLNLEPINCDALKFFYLVFSIHVVANQVYGR
jgi:hypothetical protein